MIDRSSVNAFDDPKVSPPSKRTNVQAPDRRRLNLGTVPLSENDA
jgi:hypothetical protein